MWDAEQQFSLHILIWEEFQMNAESRGYTWMIQNVSIFKHITNSQTPWVTIYELYTHVFAFVSMISMLIFPDIANKPN